MTTWDPADLQAINSAREIRIATVRPDGSTRTPLPIWVVRVGEELYVRSYHGPDGSWFRQVDKHPYARLSAADREIIVRLVPAEMSSHAEVDAAYVAKYGHSRAAAVMITPVVAPTTLRLEPGDLTYPGRPRTQGVIWTCQPDVVRAGSGASTPRPR
jgi:hypothetical protein